MKLQGAEIIIRCLKDLGVDVIFGYPGGAVLPIYDALYDSDIKHVLVAHEQMAAHMADGYARVTGKPGVCFATSGPGATNLVTGIANAYMDSVPIIAITGQVARNLIGKDSFQEVDIAGITMPITKHNYIVKDPEKLAYIIYEAFEIATTGRPGPVLIDVPKDIQAMMIEYEPINRNSINYEHKPKKNINYANIEKAVQLIDQSERPVIYAGGGIICSGAYEELKELAEKADIPVTTSLMGLGAFPEDHPLALGFLGMHGSKYANMAVYKSDLVIAIGARFSDRVAGKATGFAPDAKIIHIDIDAAEIGKNIKTNVGIVGDAKSVLRELVQKVKPNYHHEWHKQLAEMKEKYKFRYNRDGKLKPQYIVERISELTSGDAIIATEVGQNQMWAAQYYKFTKPRTFITSGGLGTMGFGLPAAIGAQVGKPDKRVINIAGDGSIRMNIKSLETAAIYNIPVITVILNNNTLGMVRQWQTLLYNKRYSHTDLNPNLDFVKLSEVYGVSACRVTNEEEFNDAIKKALGENKPALIECMIDKDEKVLPFIPAGGSVEDTIEE
ncbi:acetolactate synthase, large subunit [Caldanaerobius fijiensis DSM 17918]|uniref:Acetolactate synthase n=1 Tax=Caldanaerobius fijiensis DSM 17918 TaxID=1121256 RepID=A0A1M5AJ27_9THEO|nr:biosynthetic-type acetolactate synthase large subunit [Caldanaerobius fijiensis]SHF30281.1 acetolactate synthase, large subunit [Caldanaerobius fijiensis DSM 17918]